jgi:uncharacterized membrane protein
MRDNIILPDNIPDNTYRTDALEEINVEKKRWENRRKMAWLSLVSMIAITLILILVPESIITVSKLSVISEFVTWFYFACTGVIGAYMGVTTYAHMKK